MARPFGAQIVTTNYEVTVRKPFDARTLVTSYEDLLVKDHWLKAGTSQLVAYNGMIVSVANTSDTSKNGLYMLFDINCTTALKSPDVTSEANWLKIGENSDVSDFLERLSEIDGEIASIKDRLTTLEGYSDVETVDTFSTLPVPGTENKLYVVADERKSYVWFNDDYLPVGGSDYEEPAIIYGGSAE